MTANPPIKVFLIEPNPKILARLKDQFGGLEHFLLVGTSSRGAQAQAVIQDLRDGVDVVVVDLDAPDGIDTVKRLSTLVPAIVGASLPGLPQKTLDQALEAGMTRFTTKPFSAKELLTDIREAYRRSKGNHESGNIQSSGMPIGRLILVVAAKGGVGTSLVALNLAVGLRQSLSQTVTLIDGDLQFGDQALLSGAIKGPNITDLFDGHRQWNPQDLPSVLRPGPADILLLAAPDNARHAELVTSERFSSLLSDFRRLSNIVILDCPSHLTDIILGSLERADDIVVVTDLTASSIHNTASLLTTLNSLAVAPEKLHLVLNDCRPPAELTQEAALARLHLPGGVYLPFDTKSIQAARKATKPLLLAARKSPLGNGLVALTDALIATNPERSQVAPVATNPKRGLRLFPGRTR